MKKNWLQILSLALNVALLITLLVTRAELVNTRTILTMIRWPLAVPWARLWRNKQPSL